MTISAKSGLLPAIGFFAALLGACTPPASQSGTPLSYAPMDGRVLTEFSLEIARTRSEKAEPLAFGMLSSTFTGATPYQLNHERKAKPVQFAAAMPTPLPAMRSDGAIILPDRPARSAERPAPRLRPARGDYFGL